LLSSLDFFWNAKSNNSFATIAFFCFVLLQRLQI
jgi:hypothetical protein